MIHNSDYPFDCQHGQAIIQNNIEYKLIYIALVMFIAGQGREEEYISCHQEGSIKSLWPRCLGAQLWRKLSEWMWVQLQPATEKLNGFSFMKRNADVLGCCTHTLSHCHKAERAACRVMNFIIPTQGRNTNAASSCEIVPFDLKKPLQLTL